MTEMACINLGPLKLEASYIVSVSTLHVTKQDCDILSDAGADHPQYILRKPDTGFLVSVWHHHYDPDFSKTLVKHGHSEAYANLVRVLADAGAKYMDLDCDGADYPVFPEFDW